jgi:hypothetical protein
VTRLFRPSVWSSFALLPTAALLASHGTARGAFVFALVYLTGAVTAFLYHWHEEVRFVALDHGTAWAVVAVNCIMCLESFDLVASTAGLLAVLAALACFRLARSSPLRYERWHCAWHLFCGLAGWCFAQGYLVR